MLKRVSDQDIPRYVTTRSYGRAWLLVVVMLILATGFTIKAVQHLIRDSSGVWFYVPAAVIGIAAFAQCLFNAVWLHRHLQSSRS